MERRVKMSMMEFGVLDHCPHHVYPETVKINSKIPITYFKGAVLFGYLKKGHVYKLFFNAKKGQQIKKTYQKSFFFNF